MHESAMEEPHRTLGNNRQVACSRLIFSRPNIVGFDENVSGR